MTATIHELRPFPAQPAPAPPDVFTLIAAGLVAAGRGREAVAPLFRGFGRAAEMERLTESALAVLQASAPWTR